MAVRQTMPKKAPTIESEGRAAAKLLKKLDKLKGLAVLYQKNYEMADAAFMKRVIDMRNDTASMSNVAYVTDLLKVRVLRHAFRTAERNALKAEEEYEKRMKKALVTLTGDEWAAEDHPPTPPSYCGTALGAAGVSEEG